MGDIVNLHGRSIPIEDDELIENLARFADGTLSEAAVKSRHHLSNEDWAALGESDKLVELVEACKLRRIRSGATKRERAQSRSSMRPQFSAELCVTPTPTNGTGSIQSKHSMHLPAPELKPRQRGPDLK
jgi:hypothetical protein